MGTADHNLYINTSEYFFIIKKKKKKKKKKKMEESPVQTPRSQINSALERINKNRRKIDNQNKLDYMLVGGYLINGGKLRWHVESKSAARRTYQYYSIEIGLEGPLPRQFGKMRKEKFEEVFMKRKLTFGKVLLDSQADDEGQPRDRVTMHATARTMDSSRVGAVEISYAEVRAMIDIPTEGRTHGKNPADEDKMPDS